VRPPQRREVLVAAVERSGVVMVLDRHGIVGEAGTWVAERVAMIMGTGGYSVVQHPTGGEPFAHLSGATLEEAEYVYRALRPRRTR
jgi:hypothetical protein